MTQNIQNPGITTPARMNQPGGEQPRQLSEKGSFRGQSVRLIPGGASLIQSAAEEASFFAAERLDKRLTDYQFRSGGRATGLPEDGLSRLMERFPDLKKESQSLAFQLLQQKNLDGAKIIAALKGLTNDYQLQILTLLTVLKQGQKLGSGTQPAAFQEALAEELRRLWRKHRKQMTATLNIAGSIEKALSDSIALSRENLQSLYIDAIMDYGGLTQTYKKLLDQYGEENIQQTLDFLLSALGADMRAAERSVPSSRLRMLISDMSKLKILVTVEERCRKLCRSLQQNTGKIFDHGKTLFLLVELTSQSWAVQEKLDKLTQALGIEQSSDKIYFIRGFREILRHVPLKVFSDTFIRGQLLDSLQESLDHQVEQEELA